MLSDKPGLAHCGRAVGLLLPDGLGLRNGCAGPSFGHSQLPFSFAESSRIQTWPDCKASVLLTVRGGDCGAASVLEPDWTELELLPFLSCPPSLHGKTTHFTLNYSYTSYGQRDQCCLPALMKTKEAGGGGGGWGRGVGSGDNLAQEAISLVPF